MPKYRITDSSNNVVQETELASNEKAYDWFKEQSTADDSLGWGTRGQRGRRVDIPRPGRGRNQPQRLRQLKEPAP